MDTYPFNGGTTSCYSAYAGVPLLTLSGQSLISRVGRSIVCNLGFDTLAVESYEQYVARALELARDPALLATFRREARARFQQSSMGNGKKFAAEFEAAAQALLQQAQAGTLTNRSTVAPLPQALLLQRAELVWYHGHVEGSRRILDLCLRHYPAVAQPMFCAPAKWRAWANWSLRAVISSNTCTAWSPPLRLMRTCCWPRLR